MGKFIDLVGTTLSSFKIGKNGPMVKNNGGVLETKNNADSAYADFMTRYLRLFSTGAFKTILESTPALASDLSLVLPSTKGSSEQFLQTVPDNILNRSVLQFAAPKLDNICIQRTGTAQFVSTGGGGATVYSYTPVPSNYFLGSGSRDGASFIPSSSGTLSTVEMRIDNGFNNTGTLTAYLIQITGAVIGSNPPVIATSSAVAFNPTLFPGGSFLPVIFNFASGSLIAGTEYAVVVGLTGSGGVFGGVGTNQVTSTNYTLSNTGTNLQLSGNQNTFFEIVQVNTPAVNELQTSTESFLNVRNLPRSYHRIAPMTLAMADGDVAWVTINRNQTVPTTLPVTVQPVTAFVADENKVMIARRSGTRIYYGIDDPVILNANILVNLEFATTGNTTIKRGFLGAGAFAGGPPLIATVTFATAMPNTNYNITITGVDSRAWSYQSKTVNGFVINSNSGTALTGEVSWQAISNGESVV